MRLILTLLFGLNIINCFAQDLSPFKGRMQFNWEKSGFQEIDEETLQLIFPSIVNRPFREFSEAKLALNKYHFIDLDNDGVDEIVYNGWTGGEGEMLLIIRRSSDQFYELAQTFFGKVVNIIAKNDNYQFMLYDYACCAGNVDHLTKIDLDIESNEYKVTDDIAMAHGTYFEYDSFAPIRFTVEREVYNLRFSPKIETNLNPGSYPYDPIQNQNIITVYKKGSTGIAIAQESDNTGRIWWLVIMDHTSSINETLIYRGNNNYNEFRNIGWMSSRFLQRD